MMDFNATDETVNVVILGKSGDGKTTLINAVLGVEISETGVGFPVTQEIFSYKVPRSQLRLFDTKGFEVKDSQKTVDTVDKFIDECSRDADINKRVHCVWICVNAQSSRWEPVHQKFVSLCSKLNIPCIITVTQSYGDYERYVEVIQDNVPKDVFVIPLLAKALGLPDGSSIDPWGVNDLTEQTSSLGNSFKVRLAEQKARLERELAEQKAFLKKKESREKAELARKGFVKKVWSIFNKTIGGTVTILGLSIVVIVSLAFKDCGNKPNPLSLSRLTNPSQYQASVNRYKECSSHNSTLRWVVLISFSGSAFIAWKTFLKK
ncbi:MAG: GTPase domain-containing protein [Pseudanabaenaceae cyanobacterium bins.39]|nr:GTPase domain-containing protein [Pseudanabaenaceae cyanobacterium bins.39]